MYTDVVVGIDALDAGRDALALGETLASRSTRMTLAHVRELGRSALRDHHSAAVTGEVEILSVLAPNVASGLHDVAESRGAELLVVGSSRRAGTGRVLVGDDTRAVLDRAPCAVAVAPNGYRTRGRPVQIIGVAYDDSAQSDAALAWALVLAREIGAKVVASHVVPPNRPGVDGVAQPRAVDVDRQMARARERIGYLGDAEVSIAVGTNGETLAAFSETVDLLICGSRGNGMVRRVALGSTSGYLSRHCACPLVITTAAVQEHASSSAAPGRLATA